MKAIVVKQSNKKPVLSWQEVPDVAYGPEEVLVDIKATAVNRADLLQAQGLYLRSERPRPPMTIAAEFKHGESGVGIED